LALPASDPAKGTQGEGDDQRRRVEPDIRPRPTGATSTAKPTTKRNDIVGDPHGEEVCGRSEAMARGKIVMMRRFVIIYRLALLRLPFVTRPEP